MLIILIEMNSYIGYGTEYSGGRGVYRLIEVTWKWVNDELQLPEEARSIAVAFVTPDGTYAYQANDEL